MLCFLNPVLLKFITVSYNNPNKYSITPINDGYIFLFDMDGTLYKSTEEMKTFDLQRWERVYNQLKVRNKNAPPFEELKDRNLLNTETFVKYFKTIPRDLEKTKGSADYNRFLKEDTKLKKCLESIPVRKWCFTNAMEYRAKKVLNCLDLTDTFEGVICRDNKCFYGTVMRKPQEQVYKFVEELLQIKDKRKVFFFDDNIENIDTGCKMGWRCFHITPDTDLVGILKNIKQEMGVKFII
ncbi:pyrimidine 5 -nucleotidase [Vairimorpha ceranae]|uniref:Pyrimidine 5-nucleotidase n=1 Tax=Vairimorpha ceranae TaxID=40302 RepID=A0A0F9WCU8_9MICR|nr:pyrimidine 5 -nucleotidase [Vairimorpha ceranae]KAF5141413.1 hypothetical protein G9O61_00g004120 [Vairimorpha ceranae]KKO74650.1 pyrimidine 5 -nucleotidase [Vairimorpha ceranae]